MATVSTKIVIEADASRPVEEISEIIGRIAAMWPGSELTILKTVHSGIGEAILALEKGSEKHADVSGNGQQSSDGAGGSDHSDTDNNNLT